MLHDYKDHTTNIVLALMQLYLQMDAYICVCVIEVKRGNLPFMAFCHHTWKVILPFPNTSAPAQLRLPVPRVSTKPLKSSLSLHAKIFFYI